MKTLHFLIAAAALAVFCVPSFAIVELNQTVSDQVIDADPFAIYEFTQTQDWPDIGPKQGEYGYRLTIQAKSGLEAFRAVNEPVMVLENTSDLIGADILEFEITIGDTRYYYDFLSEFGFTTDNFVPATLNGFIPDTVNGDLNNDDEILFTNIDGFNPTDVFRLVTDIDLDGSPFTNEDFRSVLFNNGEAPNMAIRVVFDDAEGPIPEPSTVALLGFGMLLLKKFKKV